MSSDTDPRLAQIADAFQPEIGALLEDAAFMSAYSALDLDKVCHAFNEFTVKIAKYNSFHLRERRLWSIKIGTGKLNPDLETGFQESIPSGIDAYTSSFQQMEMITEELERAGFDPILQNHMNKFTIALSDIEHPLTSFVSACFHHLGCSESMLNEFRVKAGTPTNYKFSGTVFSNLADLRSITAKATAAQITILNETKENGFKYLGGRCGPPDWAITVSAILSAIGIAIGAWWVVIIVLVLLALLVVICVASPPGSWVRNQCMKLEIQLPLFKF